MKTKLILLMIGSLLLPALNYAQVPGGAFPDIQYFLTGTTWGGNSNFIMSYTSPTYYGIELQDNATNQNMFIGAPSAPSGNSTTTGTDNIGIGASTLVKLTTSALNNNAVGYHSMGNTTTGGYNDALGYETLADNVTGSNNAAFGYKTLYYCTVSYNSGFGHASLYSTTTGEYNSALGATTLYYNLTGSDNTAIGYSALESNTTSYNTALGYEALYSNTTGTYNTGEGFEALYHCTTGSGNKANGAFALFEDSTGSYNTGVGDSAGYHNTTGNYNSFFGHSADVNKDSAGNINNSTALGNGTIVTASNQVRVGNSSVSSIGGYKAWTSLSDGRVKKNIQKNIPGLVFINKLQPVSYNLDLDAIDKIHRETNNGHLSGQEIVSRQQAEKANNSGFIAQDVEKAAKSVGYDFSGVDVPKNSRDLYGLRYSDFVVPLVKAVQELSKQNDNKDSVITQQQQQLSSLQTEVDQLNTIVSKLDQALSQCCTSYQSSIGSSSTTGINDVTVGDAPSLNQNVPNPFSQNTTITCYVPLMTQSSMIVIYNLEGQELKTFTLSNSGINQVVISGGTLAVGDYLYSLIINGQRIDTKKMTLTR